ncbi:MAG: hypothetical protein VB137_09800 [Burkholderia sp.]
MPLSDVARSPRCQITRGAQGLGTLAHSGRHPRVPRPCLAADAREHGLLSPHRQPQKPPNAHDGRMTTDRPNEMWGADGAKVQTVDEGSVWDLRCG